jgi:hypothetical protein
VKKRASAKQRLSRMINTSSWNPFGVAE